MYLNIHMCIYISKNVFIGGVHVPWFENVEAREQLCEVSPVLPLSRFQLRSLGLHCTSQHPLSHLSVPFCFLRKDRRKTKKGKLHFSE